MFTSAKENRLTELCDKTITQLTAAISHLRGIKAQDDFSPNAKKWLLAMCRHLPYEGDVLVVPVGSIFAELEQMDADEVFGEREEEEMMELTSEPLRDSLHPQGL